MICKVKKIRVEIRILRTVGKRSIDVRRLEISDDVWKRGSSDKLRGYNFGKSITENLIMVEVSRLDRRKSLLNKFGKLR